MNKVNLVRKGVLIGLILFMMIFRTLFIFGFRGTNCFSNWLTPILPCQWFNVTFELILWAVVIILFLLELIWDRDFKHLIFECMKFWPIFVFVLLAVLSLTWSILFGITLYKVFVLIASTIVAVYIGYTLGNQRWLNVLILFFTVVCIASLASVILFPQGSMWAGNRAWNGIFWHKIYLGALMALAVSIYSLKLLNWRNLTSGSKIFNFVFLLVAIFLLMKSKSAAAIITAVILAGICLLIAAWIHWEKYIKRVHYVLFLGIVVIVITLVLGNLDFIFGLFGRNTSLTGRIPMWSYLFENVVSRRPILGYGYDAFWNLQGFREQMTLAMNFGLQVTQSDNGFMEILLHLGIIGLVMVIGLLVIGLVRGIKYFIQMRTMTSALPVVILIFAILANLTVSIFLETDTFVWSVVVASQVAISVPPKKIPSK